MFHVVIDWDDTLFPTSSFICKNNKILEDSVKETYINKNYYKELEEAIINLFHNIYNMTKDIYIVTNAEKSWVYLTCNRYIPRVLPFLSNIKVYSARDKWEEFFPEESYIWKYNTFRELFLNQRNIILVSIGDSIIEKKVTEEISQEIGITYKVIKLIDKPTNTFLLRQIKNLNTIILPILKNTTNKEKYKYCLTSNKFVRL